VLCEGFRLEKILLISFQMQAEQTFDTVRNALARVLSPLVAWIPDVTAFPRKRQVAIAAIASIFFHLLIVTGFVVHEFVWPVHVEPPPPAPAAPLNVQLVPKPQLHDDDDPLVKARRQILDAKGLDESTTKPADAQFESDKDMIAGSRLPATGILPLPSQQGRTDLPGHDFRDQEVRLGVTPDPTPETLRPPDPTEKQPASAPPSVTPLFIPQPLAPDTLASADKAKPVDPLPDPARTAKATPPPFKMSDKAENSVAMLVATPKPKLAATPAPPAPPATMPAPPPSLTDRFRENMRKTGVEGNIVAKGNNGVNAVNTPMGRYKRRLSQQLESLWTLKRPGENAELGTVRVSIKLREDGSVQSARVIDDGGSPRHTEICMRVIQELRPEKMPPEAEPLLDDGVMEITFSFTIYGL
jgi:outer membrane biosynthesis protein TonB